MGTNIDVYKHSMLIKSQVRSHGDGAYPKNAAGQGDVRDHNRRLRPLAGRHVSASLHIQHVDHYDFTNLTDDAWITSRYKSD
jgi:hypothetical protein